MTSAEVQELVNQIPCDLCGMSPGMAQYAVLAALVDIANGDPVPSTTQELVTEAKCLFNCVPPGLIPYLEITLLRQISEGGGGGPGSSCCHSGTGSPEGVVAASPGAVYTDTSTAHFYVKLTGAGNTGWQIIVQ